MLSLLYIALVCRFYSILAMVLVFGRCEVTDAKHGHHVVFCCFSWVLLSIYVIFALLNLILFLLSFFLLLLGTLHLFVSARPPLFFLQSDHLLTAQRLWYDLGII